MPRPIRVCKSAEACTLNYSRERDRGPISQVEERSSGVRRFSPGHEQRRRRRRGRRRGQDCREASCAAAIETRNSDLHIYSTKKIYARTRVGNEQEDDSSWNLKQNTTIIRRLSLFIKRSVNLFMYISWLFARSMINIERSYFFHISRERKSKNFEEWNWFLSPFKGKIRKGRGGQDLVAYRDKMGARWSRVSRQHRFKYRVSSPYSADGGFRDPALLKKLTL